MAKDARGWQASTRQYLERHLLESDDPVPGAGYFLRPEVYEALVGHVNSVLRPGLE